MFKALKSQFCPCFFLFFSIRGGKHSQHSGTDTRVFHFQVAEKQIKILYLKYDTNNAPKRNGEITDLALLF